MSQPRVETRGSEKTVSRRHKAKKPVEIALSCVAATLFHLSLGFQPVASYSALYSTLIFFCHAFSSVTHFLL